MYTYEDLITRYTKRTDFRVTKESPNIPYFSKYKISKDSYVYVTNNEIILLNTASNGTLVPAYYENIDLEKEYISVLEEYYRIRIHYYILRDKKQAEYNMAKLLRNNEGYNRYNTYLQELNKVYVDLKKITAYRVEKFEQIRKIAKELREANWKVKRDKQINSNNTGIRIKKNNQYTTVDPSILHIVLEQGWEIVKN